MIYKKETFEQLIRKSDCFKENIYKIDKRWKLLEHLYNSNYINNNNTKQQIPKIIHHIWLGGSLPQKYLSYVSSWRKINPGWTHFFWDDINTKGLKLINQDKFESANNLGQKADILRYEILYKYGGIYVDTDFECIKPFDDISHLEFFTGIAYPTIIEMYVGLIASIPKHPIIKSCIDDMKKISDCSANEIMNTTGNYHFTRCFLKNINTQSKDIVAFPMDFFYPFPNTDRNTIKGDHRKKYIKECSYAIHHWGVSWLNSPKNHL